MTEPSCEISFYATVRKAYLTFQMEAEFEWDTDEEPVGWNPSNDTIRYDSFRFPRWTGESDIQVYSDRRKSFIPASTGMVKLLKGFFKNDPEIEQTIDEKLQSILT